MSEIHPDSVQSRESSSSNSTGDSKNIRRVDDDGLRHRHINSKGEFYYHFHAIGKVEDAECSHDHFDQHCAHGENERSHESNQEGGGEENKSSLRRLFIIRIALRVSVVVVVVLLIRFLPLPFGDWLEAFIDLVSDIQEDGPLGIWLSVFVYSLFSVAFCSVLPTGYLPTIVGGMIFPPYFSITISWIGVNMGALLNMIWVRSGCLKGCVQKVIGRAIGRYEGLENMLKEEPFKTVVILRLPFMYNGLLNYVFATSCVAVKPYISGNALGFIPGCVVFSFLGDKVKSITKIVATGDVSVEEALILLSVCAGIAISVLAFRWISKRTQRRLDAVRTRARLRSEGDSGL